VSELSCGGVQDRLRRTRFVFVELDYLVVQLVVVEKKVVRGNEQVKMFWVNKLDFGGSA
jgi:hypothetical protein